MTLIFPSILENSFEELQRKAGMSEPYVERIQVDFCDGRFVPGKTVWVDEFKNLKFGKKVEAHLMIEEPLEWVADFAKRADIILFHLEATDKPFAVIDAIHKCGKKAGIVINPETPAAQVFPFLDQVAQVQVMSVVPGKQGQPFIEGSVDKVREIRENRRDIPIEVDGHMDPETAPKVVRAGATIVCPGSFAFRTGNVKDAIEAIRKAIETQHG
ncbi:ribulose-phosphate 3-epimerase [Candidatus Woesearchaeota archaeon]|nr:ribulose-phosphate 3-epimerase [Candidatus Woesearchaeota archaeon]